MERSSIGNLAWMVGRWVGQAFGGTIEETFGSPNGGCVLGTSRVVADGKTLHREFILIVERDGRIDYEVRIADRAPHSFRLETVGGNSARWIDPSNLWPKSIEYRRTDEGLAVSLLGEDQSGSPRSVSFTMRPAE